MLLTVFPHLNWPPVDSTLLLCSANLKKEHVEFASSSICFSICVFVLVFVFVFANLEEELIKVASGWLG